MPLYVNLSTVFDEVYSTTGTKLRQAITQSGTTVTRDYVAGLEYVGGQLEAIFHGEGRIVSTNGNNVSTGLRYEYNIEDHSACFGVGAPKVSRSAGGGRSQ